MGYDDTVHLDDPFWMAAAKAEHAENYDHLFDWGIEDARRHFVSPYKHDSVLGAPWYADSLPDGDCWRSLPNGTPVDARFAFFGTGGGWLTLTMFEGITMDSTCDLDDCDYQFLRKLCRFLVDLQDSVKNAASWVEDASAFTFFANICADCETRETRIAAWELDQSGDH